MGHPLSFVLGAGDNYNNNKKNNNNAALLIDDLVPDDKRSIVSLLSKQVGRRLRLISSFPSMAEVFIDGQARCVQLLSFDGTANKFQVRQSNGTLQTIDFGQLTSMLGDGTVLRSYHDDISREERRRYEVPLDELYYSYVGRGRFNPLVKKRLAKWGQSSADEAILRSVLKAGANMARLVDASCVVRLPTLFSATTPKREDDSNVFPASMSRRRATVLLSLSTEAGSSRIAAREPRSKRASLRPATAPLKPLRIARLFANWNVLPWESSLSEKRKKRRKSMFKPF
jgi:hypothetical protein